MNDSKGLSLPTIRDISVCQLVTASFSKIIEALCHFINVFKKQLKKQEYGLNLPKTQLLGKSRFHETML